MAKENQNFTIHAGESKTLIVSVVDEKGLPVDLTGAQIKWMLYRSPTSPSSDIYKDNVSMTDAIASADPVSGQFTVNIVAADTANLTGEYFHAAQVTDALNNVSVVTKGKVTVSPIRKFQQ